jgi:3-oxoacyl-[acyl-carrier-protein] synthase-3
MAEGAARQALDDAKLTPADVDFLIIGTTSPDVVFPNVGCLLQERLGISGGAAFSVEAGSAGFIYALSIADRFIASAQAQCALVIGADTLAGGSEGHDRASPADYAAAAGAVVLEAASEPGIVAMHLGADRDDKNIPQGAAAPRETEGFKPAWASLRTVLDETLARHGLSIDEINGVLPQQADLPAIQAMARHLGIPMQKVILTRDYHGDRAAAEVPLALDLAIREGRIGAGDLLLLVALGDTVTWGSALIRL